MTKKTNRAIRKAVKRTVNAFSDIGNKIKDRTDDFGYMMKTFILGRTGLSPHVKRVLHNRGQQVFVIDEIRRAPVPSMIQKFINVLSGNKVPYDVLFHLSIVGHFPDGQRLIIEKNEVINVSMKIYRTPHTDVVKISDPAPKTLNEIFQNTREQMGDKFIPYSAYDNNCQNFISNLLHANGHHNPEYDEFVMQDTAVIFQKNPVLRKFANTLTDIGARVDVLKQGGSLPQSHAIAMHTNPDGTYYFRGLLRNPLT